MITKFSLAGEKISSYVKSAHEEEGCRGFEGARFVDPPPTPPLSNSPSPSGRMTNVT